MKPFVRLADNTALVACPVCGSRNCQVQSIAQKAGMVVGGILGAIIAAGVGSAPVEPDNDGALVSIVSGLLPVTLTERISRALVGFTWGTIAGHTAGAKLDEHTIRAYQCYACGLKF